MSRKRKPPRTSAKKPRLSRWLKTGILVLLGLGWYGREIYVERPKMAWQGVPQSTQNDLAHLSAHILRNPGFMLNYSEWKGAPLWVTYRLFRPKGKGHRMGKRPSFSSDWRTLRRITPDDYRRSGYDRGHMAPNYAIARLYGREAQKATFLMSNIAPQRPRLNRKLWQRIEQAAMDHFVKLFEEVWVVTGPVWDAKPRYMKTAWLDVPDAFYKIFVGIDRTGNPFSLAFLAPQEVRGIEPLSKFVVSIDEVEKRTGLDFFWRLPDAREERLEAHSNLRRFQLQKVNRLPSKY